MSTHNDTFKWKANFSMLMNDVVNHGWISVLPPMYRVGSGDQDMNFFDFCHKIKSLGVLLSIIEVCLFN